MGLQSGPSLSGPVSYQISYRQRMQSHDCYCFLSMTSLLLQPYRPRKDAIKVFETGLNDVALQVSNIILQKNDLLVTVVLLSCRAGFLLEKDAAWFLCEQGLQVQRLPAGSVLVFRLISPTEMLPDGALKPKKALCTCVLPWLLRESAEFRVCVSSHRHPVVQRESAEYTVFFLHCRLGFFFLDA